MSLRRRDFLGAAAKASLGLACAPAALRAADTTPAKGPNILWITMEDTTASFLGCYGNGDAHTPNMDRLATEGVQFNRAFSTAPVCSPSRSAIITGCLAEQLGTGQHRSRIVFPSNIKGFPYYLRKAGYFTSNNLKTDYNVDHETPFLAEAFDASYGAGGWGTSYEPVQDTWDENAAEAGWWLRKPGQPFFSVFNLMNSHQSRTMTYPHDWFVEKIRTKLPPERLSSAEKLTVPPIYRDSPEMRQHLSRVYDAISMMDLELGCIRQRLVDDGLAEDTMIFCFADHGEGLPRGKMCSLSMGFHVPFLAYIPPCWQHLSPWKIGEPTNELVSTSEDVAPTMLSLAGVDIPGYMTGRALMGTGRREPRKYVWGARNRIEDSPDTTRSVTDGAYFYTRVFMPQWPLMKYVKYGEVAEITRSIRADQQAGKLDALQASFVQPRQPLEYLYKIDEDPWETRNLATDPAAAKTLQEMRGALLSHIEETRDIHFMPEYEMHRRMRDETPYEFRMDPAAYPMARVLEAAVLVGASEPVLARQLELLRDDDVSVRYWAALGLDASGPEVETAKAQILNALGDKHPSVQIVAAGTAYRNFQNAKAFELLNQFALGDDERLALQALQMIQNMGEGGRPFVPTLLTLKDRYKGGKTLNSMEGSDGKRSPAVNAMIDVSLHFLEGQPLFLNDFKAWMPPERLLPETGIRYTT